MGERIRTKKLALLFSMLSIMLYISGCIILFPHYSRLGWLVLSRGIVFIPYLGTLISVILSRRGYLSSRQSVVLIMGICVLLNILFGFINGFSMLSTNFNVRPLGLYNFFQRVASFNSVCEILCVIDFISLLFMTISTKRIPLVYATIMIVVTMTGSAYELYYGIRYYSSFYPDTFLFLAAYASLMCVIFCLGFDFTKENRILLLTSFAYSLGEYLFPDPVEEEESEVESSEATDISDEMAWEVLSIHGIATNNRKLLSAMYELEKLSSNNHLVMIGQTASCECYKTMLMEAKTALSSAKEIERFVPDSFSDRLNELIIEEDEQRFRLNLLLFMSHVTSNYNPHLFTLYVNLYGIENNMDLA